MISPWQANVSSVWEIHVVATAGNSLKGRFQGHKQLMGTSLDVSFTGLKKELRGAENFYLLNELCKLIRYK